ncbi:MAG: hypothetical protein VW057_08825 [Rhodospirillaceae bacterium]
MTDKRYSVVLPKYACSSIQRWERKEGKKPEDIFIFKQERRAFAVILTVKDGEPFDIEKLRNNANGEWGDYDFEEDLDAGEEADLHFQRRNTRCENAFLPTATLRWRKRQRKTGLCCFTTKQDIATLVMS